MRRHRVNGVSSAPSRGAMDSPPATLATPCIAVLRLRHAARWHALATAAIPGTLAAPLVAALVAPSLALHAFVACAVVALFSGLWAQRLRTPSWQPGAIEVGALGVRVRRGESAIEVARASLERAVVLLGVEGPLLELHLAGGDIVRAALRSAEEGERFVRDAGLPRTPSVEDIRFATTAHQVVVFVLRWGFGMGATGAIAATAASLLSNTSEEVLGVLFAAATLAMTALVGWTAVPRWLQVGADGVTVRRGPTRRFIPYNAVTSVYLASEDGVAVLVVEWVEGGRVRILAPPPYEGSPQRALLAIGARMQAWRLQAMRERGALARGGRDIATWRDAVAAEMGGAGVFRDAAFGREALVELAESPVAPPTQRLGAALALADAGDEVRTRVRVAADACANEALQEALRAALDRRLDEPLAERVERAEAALAPPEETR